MSEMAEGDGMTEEEKRKAHQMARETARAQQEIAAHLASLTATLERFNREREELFTATVEDARKLHRPSLWP